MNKTTKASVATAAGIVLLLGGGASLAYWTDSAATGSGTQTISAGTLTITPVNSGAWTKGFYNAAGTQVTAPVAATLGTVKLVPGNRLVYTQVFNVVATGQDLYFTVGVDGRHAHQPHERSGHSTHVDLHRRGARAPRVRPSWRPLRLARGRLAPPAPAPRLSRSRGRSTGTSVLRVAPLSTTPRRPAPSTSRRVLSR